MRKEGGRPHWMNESVINCLLDSAGVGAGGTVRKCLPTDRPTDQPTGAVEVRLEMNYYWLVILNGSNSP